jgi:tyrosyl-tRNA synthetase
MLTFESVKTRLDREQSLSYMEFNYMILQAYDFLELNKKEELFFDKLVVLISGEI